MKKVLLPFLLLSATLSFAQITFETDTVFLINNGSNGVYENTIDISSSSSDLADLRWERVERTIEPLVWNTYVYSCDSLFFPNSIAGPVTRETNKQSCSLGVNITNLEEGLPRGINQVRLLITSISNAALNDTLTYILQAVPVKTKELSTSNVVQVAPNPIGDKMTLTFDESLIDFPLQVSILNIQGKVKAVHSINTSTASIETEHWANGIYLIRIETEEKVWVKKVIK